MSRDVKMKIENVFIYSCEVCGHFFFSKEERELGCPECRAKECEAKDKIVGELNHKVHRL